MKIITKSREETKITFGNLKAGDAFLDIDNFGGSYLLIKVNKLQDPDNMLTDGIEGEEGCAAVGLLDGAIYFYNDHELVNKAEATITINKLF
jgi:hypothetical protein